MSSSVDSSLIEKRHKEYNYKLVSTSPRVCSDDPLATLAIYENNSSTPRIIDSQLIIAFNIQEKKQSEDTMEHERGSKFLQFVAAIAGNYYYLLLQLSKSCSNRYKIVPPFQNLFCQLK